MKKLKFLTLAAIAAATAMVSSCSDNDVLEGAKSKGVPLTVNATTTSNGSRSTDILSKDLTTFQLWGFGIDENRFDGDNFTKNGSVFKSATDHIYPGSDNYLFYGISNNTSTMAYGVPTGSPGINTSKAAIVDDGGKFVYTIPTNVADQEDLLVAAAKGNATQGVTMHFDHALAAAKLHLIITPSKTQQGQAETHYMFAVKINKIKFKNIIVSGTYNFGEGSPVGATSSTTAQNGYWDISSGTRGDYVIDFSSNPLIIQTPYNVVADVPVNVDGINNENGNVYFIPQTVTPWEIHGNANMDVTPPTDNRSYIEFEAISMVYPYENLLTEFEGFIGNVDGLSKDPEGNFVFDDPDDETDVPHIIIKNTGEVVDFSYVHFSDWTVGTNPDTAVYDEANSSAQFLFTDFDELGFGIFYKPFKPSQLDINGNRIFKVELTSGANAANSNATFGFGAEVTG